MVEATPRVRGASRTVGIIGWPVSHSLSPAVHNAAFAAMGLEWVYVPLPVAPAALAQALAGLAALGFAGANVTMPHKTKTAERMDILSEDARRLNAVNTIVVQGGELHGHNTDGQGFERFLREDAGFDPGGRSALIFGAGGAARAAALALARAGLASLSVAVRDPVRTAGLVAALDGLETEVRPITFEASPAERPDLVINATPLGASGESSPAAAGARAARGRPHVSPLRDPDAAAGPRGGGGGLRRAGHAAAPGRAVLRAVDGNARPARRHVGRRPGGAGRTGLTSAAARGRPYRIPAARFKRRAASDDAYE